MILGKLNLGVTGTGLNACNFFYVGGWFCLFFRSDLLTSFKIDRLNLLNCYLGGHNERPSRRWQVRKASNLSILAKTNISDGFTNTNFRTPLSFLECLKSSISIGEN